MENDIIEIDKNIKEAFNEYNAETIIYQHYETMLHEKCSKIQQMLHVTIANYKNKCKLYENKIGELTKEVEKLKKGNQNGKRQKKTSRKKTKHI